jgi:hypothetical protein
MPDYYISGGVRRSLAARELSHADILARVIEPGVTDRLVRVPLGSLHSPKSAVARDWRYLRVLQAMASGATIQPIDVEPLGSPGQSASVPLGRVVVQ